MEGFDNLTIFRLLGCPQDPRAVPRDPCASGTRLRSTPAVPSHSGVPWQPGIGHPGLPTSSRKAFLHILAYQTWIWLVLIVALIFLWFAVRSLRCVSSGEPKNGHFRWLEPRAMSFWLGTDLGRLLTKFFRCTHPRATF